MRLLKNVMIAMLAGIVVAIIFSQFTTSKYPPCDLVEKGIGVSTYGCSNTPSSNYPCKDITPNYSEMMTCIQQNYYRSKTFPFGFKQDFGPDSNLVDQKPLINNWLASFIIGFMVTLLILSVIQPRKNPLRQTEK